MNTGTILGIDPGTRFIGITVMRDGQIKHYQVRTFSGPWSYTKLQAIMAWIDAVIGRHSIIQIAVKIPDTFPMSVGYNQLIGALNIFCRNKSIAIHYYQLSELKTVYCKSGKHTSEGLMNAILVKYPELMPEYKKEQRNRNAHYHKLFEAVAAAHMLYSTKIA